MRFCVWCKSTLTGNKRKFCGKSHKTRFFVRKRRHDLLTAHGNKCDVCSATSSLFVYIKEDKVLCGSHNIEFTLSKFNERLPSNNPAKMASILGRETFLQRRWESRSNPSKASQRRNSDY